ncbi:MAG: tetratricopeptide repeat protein, partial [Bacteroidia bacterium]
GKASVLYIPLTICSYYLDGFLGGDAISFHFVNLFLHLLNILLLYKLLRLLKLPEYLTLIVLIFFALNPVITESVCWITERKDVLYAFFLLCAAIFFLKDQQQKSQRCYYASLFLFILACLSKPMAVSFPLVAAVYLYANGTLKESFIKMIPFVLVAVFISFITYYFIVIKNGPLSKTTFSGYSISQKSFLFISETGFYFTRYLWPVNISLFHFFPGPTELYSFKITLCFVAGLTYIFCLYYFRSNKNILCLLIAWLIMLLPVMQIIPNSQSYVNERYFYLTLILPVYFGGFFLQKMLKVKTFLFLSYSLVVIFAILTFKQAQCWNNSETLFQYELSLDNKNRSALNILGCYYNGIGEFYKARPYLAKALSIDSTNASCLNNYGWCLYGMGKPDSGIVFLKRATLYKRNFLEAYNNLGVCYLHNGEKEKALEEFKAAERIKKDHPDVMFNLGVCYFFDKERQLGIYYLKNAAAKGHKRAQQLIEKYKLYSAL